MDGKAVGERIKRRRKALRLTQKALAAKAGIFPQSISRYELGRVPDTEELTRLAEALYVSPAYLLGADGPTTGSGQVSESPAPSPKIVTKTYDHPDVIVAIGELRQYPSSVPWVLGLLRILAKRDLDATHGITSNINAFLGDLKLEKVDPEGKKKKASGGG